MQGSGLLQQAGIGRRARKVVPFRFSVPLEGQLGFHSLNKLGHGARDLRGLSLHRNRVRSLVTRLLHEEERAYGQPHLLDFQLDVREGVPHR